MINSIQLLNFQAHKNTSIDFHEGVNLILGSSDNGKSSILRGINWVVNNQPKGNSFIREGADETKIVIHSDTGVVERGRTTKDTGAYIVNGEEFSKGDTPEEVFNLLQLQEINIQMQLDSYFLILDTPGNVSRYLNSITRLDKLTNAVGYLKKDLLARNRELVDVKKQIEDTEVYLNSGVQDDLKDLEDIEKEVTEVQGKVNNLSQKLSNCREVVYTIKRNEMLLEREVDVKKAILLLRKCYKILIQVEELEDKHETNKKLVSSLRNYYININVGQAELEGLEREQTELIQELEVCPFCGQEMDTEVKERL